jgi:hypothetical protein
MVEYQNTSTSLHQNISTLVPSEVANPASITQYLGLKDWYTMHFFVICSGFFAPSAINPSLLTSARVNITCVRQSTGYTFSLSDILQADLKPGLRDLSKEVADNVKSYNTAPWVHLWITGISSCFLTILVLPWKFVGAAGRRALLPLSFLYSGACIYLSYRWPLLSKIDLVYDFLHRRRTHYWTCARNSSVGLLARSLS